MIAHRAPQSGGTEARTGLRMIVNVIVLWNPIYIDAAVSQLRKDGFLVRDEDVARLSPLGQEHINMLGRYTFTLPDQVARGKLRCPRIWRFCLPSAAHVTSKAWTPASSKYGSHKRKTPPRIIGAALDGCK